jgi:hypothetical protein
MAAICLHLSRLTFTEFLGESGFPREPADVLLVNKQVKKIPFDYPMFD